MHPQILHLGRLILPTFGVLAALGLMSALALSLRTATLVGLNPDRIWNAGLFSLIAAFILSRFLLVVSNLHSFFAYPFLLLAVPSLTPIGVLLTALSTLLYLWLLQIPILQTLDAWAPCATLTWVFLALGHFAEGSDPGLTTTVPWAVLSPTGGAHLHPVALYAATAAILITGLLLRQLARPHRPGDILALALATSGAAQFLITFFREPVPSPGNALTNLLDPIQWVALAMILAAGLISLRPSHPKLRKPVPHAL
jgi:phosphatidylglycerol---prolipoprotein diacylglyceryl transferase